MPPDSKTARLERIKALPRPEGMVQCPRCGGRDTLIIRHGDRIENGRLKPGMVMDHGLCPHCWRSGITMDLIPPKPKIVKEPKPRRKKPKLVK